VHALQFGGGKLFGVEEVILLSVIVLVVFGPDKLPEVARVLGKAAKEFRKVTYTAQRAWDEIGREMDVQEAGVKAGLLEEKRQAEAGRQADEERSAGAGDSPQAESAPALENAGGGQGETPDAGCLPEIVTSKTEEQING
jgi:TatA/E family protein of Tat protein translocase